MLNFIFLAALTFFPVVFASDEDCSAFYPTQSSEKSCEYKILAHYRQQSYLPEDPLGDYVLLKGLDLRIKEKVQLLFGKKTIQEDLRLALFDEANQTEALRLLGLPAPTKPIYVSEEVDFDVQKLQEQVLATDLPDDIKERLITTPGAVRIEGQKNPLKVEGLTKMFSQVIFEESLKNSDACESMTPKIGQESKWSHGPSPITGKPLRSKYKLFSKLLVALAMGETNAYLYVGQEPQLRDWLLLQPSRSVTLESIFRESYRLNCGNVANTLMTILNVLSEHFRFSNRQQLIQTTKLSPIINHLGNRADVFGPWYHFFGLMIYGYHHGVVLGTIMGNIEKGTSLFYNEVDERQENYMLGALRVGKKIKKMIEQDQFKAFESSPESLQREEYLDLSEDFTKKLEKMNK